MNMNMMHRRPARRAATLLLVFLVTAGLAGCTGSDDDSTDVSTDTTDSSETSETTTDTTDTTGTTETSSSTSSESTATTSSTTATGSTDDAATPVPEGSGCTPGDVDTLPDGRWFGYASSREADSFSFDLACWFTGEDAVLAAIEDGEISPPPNDYHVRNDNETQRLVVPAPNATVEYLANPGDPATVETIDYPTWVSDSEARPFEPGVWIEISDGLVVSVEEQYQP